MTITVFAQHWDALGPFLKPDINDSTDRSLFQANGIGRVGAVRFIGKGTRKKTIICTPYDGIRISDHSCTAWFRPSLAGLPSAGVADIVALDARGKHLLSVTGDADCGLDPNGPAMNSESCQSRGVYMSRDGGQSWNGPIGRWHTSSGQIDSSFWYYPSLKVSRKLVVDRSCKSLMFILVFTCDPVTKALSSAVYRTANGGKDWYPVLRVTGESLKDLDCSPENHKIIFAAGKTVYRSIDGGIHWESLQARGLPPVSEVNRCEMAISKSNPGQLLVLVSNAKSKLNELYVSDNVRDTLYKVCSGAISPEWRSALAVDQHSSSLIYFTAGNKINRFEKKGASWKAVPTGTEYHDDVHELTADPCCPGRMFASTDGGLFMSMDTGKTWNDCSNGLNVAESWGVAACFDGANGRLKILSGMQDCGTVMLNVPRDSISMNWKIVRGGDGMQPAINPAGCSRMYATDGNNNLNHFSNDEGIHWKMTASVRTEAAEYVRPFVIDPESRGVLYTGYTDLYRSEDDGMHWSPLHVTGATGKIAAIALAPSDNRVIYVAYAQPCWSDSVYGKLFRTMDGGRIWEDITAGLRGVAWTSISSIAVHPEDPFDVAVGFRGGWTVKVMRSIGSAPGKIIWSDCSAGLPRDADVNCLEFDPGPFDATLFAGTHRGVFINQGKGGKWKDFNGNMPAVLTIDLAIDKQSGIMVAGTHGAGIWMTRIR